MRLAMIQHSGRTGVALDMGGRTLLAIFEGQDGYPGSLDSVLARGGGLASAAERIEAEGESLSADNVTFLPPLMRSGKIICVGLNYRDHAAESQQSLPLYPEIFFRAASSLVGAGEPIRTTPLSDQLDYEAELVAVIGRTAKSVSRDAALNHVAAYSVFNDASIRDFQLRTMQWTVGKNFDGTGGFGPWLVDADSLPPGATGLRVTTTLNGQIVQDANTADMLFDVATLVEQLSSSMTLDPGDIIVTGTPSGVGLARSPKLWMRSGDEVVVEVESVGKLVNPVL